MPSFDSPPLGTTNAFSKLITLFDSPVVPSEPHIPPNPIVEAGIPPNPIFPDHPSIEILGVLLGDTVELG